MPGNLQLLTTDPDVPVQARSEWHEKQMWLDLVLSPGSQSRRVMLIKLLPILEAGDL